MLKHVKKENMLCNCFIVKAHLYSLCKSPTYLKLPPMKEKLY